MITDKMISSYRKSSSSYIGPVYSILETTKDSITGVTWHKLITNSKATRLIVESKAYSSWEIKAENTGKKYIWVTDNLLLLLKIQGLQHNQIRLP